MLGFSMFSCVLLELARRERGHRSIIHHYRTSFLVNFLSCLLIPYDGCKSLGLSVMLGLLKECLIGENR